MAMEQLTGLVERADRSLKIEKTEKGEQNRLKQSDGRTQRGLKVEMS